MGGPQSKQWDSAPPRVEAALAFSGYSCSAVLTDISLVIGQQSMTKTKLKTSNHEGHVIVWYSVARISIGQNRLGVVEVWRILTAISVTARLQQQQFGHVQQQLCKPQKLTISYSSTCE